MARVEGEVVCSVNSIGYQEVLDDFPNARRVHIVTYNISSSREGLLDHIRSLGPEVDVSIVSNIPGRWETYYDKQKYTARSAIQRYIKKLDPRKFDAQVRTYFNFKNHSKLIATENVAYLGSANFSDESQDSYEAGIVVRDPASIRALVDSVFGPVLATATEYIPGDIDDNGGIMVPLSLAQQRLEAFISVFDNCFVEWHEPPPHLGGQDQRVFVAKSGAPGSTEKLEDALDAVEELLECADAVSGILSIVGRHLTESMVTELRDLFGYRTDMAKLLEFSVAAEIRTAVENDRDAYDEGLDLAQERAADAAEEKLQYLFDAVGAKACEAFYEKLEALVDALRSTKDDLTLEVAKSEELDNTR